MRMLALVATTAALAGFATVANAQDAKTGDPKVGALLKQAGLECKVDDDGDWLCTLPISDSRTEAVWVMSQTSKNGGFETRRIFSVAYISDGPLSAADANALLEENNTYGQFGAWLVQSSGGKSVVAFGAQVSANLTAADLVSAMGGVAVFTDQKEQAKTGKDQY